MHCKIQFIPKCITSLCSFISIAYCRNWYKCLLLLSKSISVLVEIYLRSCRNLVSVLVGTSFRSCRKPFSRNSRIWFSTPNSFLIVNLIWLTPGTPNWLIIRIYQLGESGAGYERLVHKWASNTVLPLINHAMATISNLELGGLSPLAPLTFLTLISPNL